LWGLVAHRRGYRLIDTAGAAVPEDLIGFDAPPEWAGIVLGTTGTMRHVDDPRRPEKVRLGYALDRTGATATAVTTLDGRILATPRSPAVGHIPDVAHRILGMACAPEPTSPLPLLISSWLLEVVDLATDPAMAGWTDDWLAVADLHPAAELCTGRSPGELSAALQLDGAVPSWSELYDAARAVGIGIGGFEPWEVEWLDPPSLARFLLARTSAITDLLGRVVDVVPGDVGEAIAKCVLGAATVDGR
jgi:hypothetical protein